MKNSESKYYNTALLMNEALLFLLEKKDYEFITIKEVCEKAGVNRTTFYLHYESIDDLLLETVAMINKKFYAAFDSKYLDVHNLNKNDLFLIVRARVPTATEFIHCFQVHIGFLYLVKLYNFELAFLCVVPILEKFIKFCTNLVENGVKRT